MSSRSAEKERRKQDRLERERENAESERRSRARRRALSGMASMALVAGVVTLVVVGRDGAGSGAPASGPFGPHYAGLEARRNAARVPTMMDTMASPVHFHPRLTVQLDGKPLSVPANLGIDPDQDAMQMAGLHTHDASGTIHAEGSPGATLAQLFAVWGVRFSATQFGPYRGVAVRLWVDGKPSRAYGKLKLADRQQVKVVVTGARKAA